MQKKSKPHVPTFKEAEKAFSGVRFDVRSLDVPGKGNKPVRRDVVVHPGAVLILPLLDKDHLVMIRNQRFAVGQELWELPAGTLEKNETPENTAARELIEETGYRAEKIELLTTFFTTPGWCNEVMYTYVATHLSHVGQSLDESERIIVEIVPWPKALKMVQDGTIMDGKTIATLLYFQAFSQR